MQGAEMRIWSLTPMVKRILIANAGIWLISVVLRRTGLFHWLDVLALTPSDVVERLWVWQVFTYMWLHSTIDFMHIILNSLFLWMFGGALEQMWGGRGLLKFYLLCGIFAGLTVLVAGLLFSPNDATVGASGAVYGLVAAWALVLPGRYVYIFGIFPVKGLVVAGIPVALALLEFITARDSGVSHAAHLGGLAAGALLVTGYWRPSRIAGLWKRNRSQRRFRVIDGDGRRPPPNGGYWN